MATRTRRLNTALRQKQIVEAAQKVIVRYGSEHVTVRRIAREVGISEGDIYRHFKSKSDVLFFLAQHVEDNLLADIDAVPPNVSPLQTLGLVLSNHLSAISQRKGVGFQVVAEIISLGDRKLNRRILGVIDKYTGRIRSLLSEAVEAGEIRPDVDLDTAALAFFGLVQGVANVWTLNNRAFTLEERYEPLWNIFRESVVKR